MRSTKELALLVVGNIGRRLAEWADWKLEQHHLRLLERCDSLSPRRPHIPAKEVREKLIGVM